MIVPIYRAEVRFTEPRNPSKKPGVSHNYSYRPMTAGVTKLKDIWDCDQDASDTPLCYVSVPPGAVLEDDCIWFDG